MALLAAGFYFFLSLALSVNILLCHLIFKALIKGLWRCSRVDDPAPSLEVLIAVSEVGPGKLQLQRVPR